MDKLARITSREAAQILGCRKPTDAVALLRAAQITATHCGAAWLWDAAEVERLETVLRQIPPAPADSEWGPA